MSQLLLPTKIENLIIKLYENIDKVIYGRKATVDKLVMALLAGGHVLLEDVPGIGKTLMAKVISKSIDADFKRIQCTPDLLPSDITGVSIFNNQQGEFKFIPGPLFTNVLLVDEINRAAPRTQSCLLEAMEESQVTVEGKTFQLNKPFFVIATQNPLEYHGTFELPEAQLDRFLMIVSLGYPALNEEISVMDFYLNNLTNDIAPALSREDYVYMHNYLKRITVTKEIKHYIMDIVKETRNTPEIKVGVSTRGALSLLKVSQASAMLSKRSCVLPDDVKSVAEDVLSHRIITVNKGDLACNSTLISEIVSRIKVPV